MVLGEIVAAGDNDELAAIEMVGGRKMMSSGLGKPIRTRVTSFEGPMMLGAGVVGVV